MKYKILLFLSVIIVFAIAQGNKNGKDSAPLSNYQDSISYILGRDVGSQLQKFDTKIHINQFVKGLEQALNNTKSEIDSLKSDSMRQNFATQVQEKAMKEEQALAEKNKKESDEFLAQNKKKAGVKTTSSGLQYQVIEKGKGPKPTMNDSVMVIYKGMLADNKVFDSTPNNNPVPLYLSKTIPGLAEGIQLMNEGAKYRFFVPPELAYGPQGAPPVIPPNSVLIFEITLDKVLKSK